MGKSGRYKPGQRGDRSGERKKRETRIKQEAEAAGAAASAHRAGVAEGQVAELKAEGARATAQIARLQALADNLQSEVGRLQAEVLAERTLRVHWEGEAELLRAKCKHSNGRSSRLAFLF